MLFAACAAPDAISLLQVRTKTAAEVAEEEELLKKEAEKMASQGDGGEEDAFLQDFVGNRRWLDPHSKETPRFGKLSVCIRWKVARVAPCRCCCALSAFILC